MCPSSGELIVSIRHLVYVTLYTCRFGWDCVSSKPAHETVIYTEWHIPDVVLIQLILLMMGTWLPETRREQKINIHEKELCVKLVIYKGFVGCPLFQKLERCNVIWTQHSRLLYNWSNYYSIIYRENVSFIQNMVTVYHTRSTTPKELCFVICILCTVGKKRGSAISKHNAVFLPVAWITKGSEQEI